MPNYLVITGGSRGIGESTIACYLKQGWKVVNISRHPCSLAQVVNIHLDLSNPLLIEQQAESLIAAVSDANLICLVHNAGYYNRDTIESVLQDDLERTLNVSIVAPAMLNKIFIPQMQAGSSIIYIGSTLSEKAVPNAVSYVVSRHAIVGLMRATCQDLNGKYIHTACVCPGLTDTQMLRETMDQKTIDYFLGQKVIGKRLIDPAEIADVIYFCAKSPAINGAIIHANLGQVAD